MATIPFNVKLDKINYQGESVGREWTFNLLVGSQQTTLTRTVRPGKTVTVDQSVYMESVEIADGNPYFLPVQLTATENDPAYPETGQAFDTFGLLPGTANPQMFTMQVSVREVGPPHATDPIEPAHPISALESATPGVGTSLVDFIPTIRFGDLGFQPPVAYSGLNNYPTGIVPTEPMIAGEATWKIDLSSPGLAGQRFELRSGFNIEAGVPSFVSSLPMLEAAISLSYEIQIDGATVYQRDLNGEIRPSQIDLFDFSGRVVRETSGLEGVPTASISLDDYVGSIITLTQKYAGQSTPLNAVQVLPALIAQAQFAIVPLGPDPNAPPPAPVDEPNEALLTFTFSASEVKPQVFPKIFSVTPARGPVKGGTPVEIKGENFVEGCTTRFDGVEAKNVTFVNSETLAVTTPRHPMAGQVNVRVINPDGEKDTLEKGFQYDGVPLLFEVVSDEGPAIPPEDTETPFQVVKILGLHFQEGIEVYFAKSQARVLFVDPDGQLLKVEVPRRAKQGAVNVKVVNLDGGRATLTDGFKFLGPKQQQRVRIRKVVPLTLFDNTPQQKIIIYGRNIHDALDNGLLGLRVPSRLELIYDSVEKLLDPDTEEEMVVYNLTPMSTPPLEGPERMILLVVASRRSNARDDMIVDTSKTTVTLLPKDLPVPIGFTAKLAGGQSNLVMVAGRNLQDTTLSLDVSEGVEINHQFSEDGLVAALVNVPMEMSQSPLNLILGKGGSEVGRYPLQVQMMPTGGMTGIAGSMPSQVSEFEAVPNQNVLAPTEEDSVVYALSTDPNAPTQKLERGTPRFDNNPNLIPQLKVNVFTLKLRFFILNEVRFLPLFDRGGPAIEEEPLQGKVGKILPVRNLNLIVVIRVFLDVTIRVAVVFSFNPFLDFKSTERFNEFPDQLTDSKIYGTIVVAVVVTVELQLAVQFFVALILPDLSLTVLAAFQLNLQITIGSRGAQLNLGVGGYIRANLPAGGQPIRPLALPAPQGDGLQLLAGETFPDKVSLGRLAYYFAREAGTYCLDWDYGDFEIVQSFQSGGQEQTIFKPTTVVTCLLVNPSEKLRIVRIEPDPLNVEQGAAEIVRAFAKEIKNGQLTGDEIELQPDKVNFLPAMAAAPFTTERDMCKPGGNKEQVLHWYVRGNQPDEEIMLNQEVILLVQVKATGKEAPALFPSRDLGFVLFPFVLQGEAPRVEIEGGKVIVRPPLFTPPLNAQRQRLFADYATRKFGSGKSLTQAWDNLECSQKGVFLTITHRLHTSKIDATNQSLLSLVQELYSIRGMGGTDCGDLPYNRMWMKMDAALLTAFNEQNVKEAQVIRDTNFGTWWKMSEDGFFVFGGPHDPFNASDETVTDEPRGQAHFFKLNKFSSELKKLRDQLSDVKGELTKREEVFKGNEDLRALLPPKSEIKQMPLDQLEVLKQGILLLLEMDQDYSPKHKSCTEKLEYKDDKGREVTGRILYRDHYGLQIPTDFGWRPVDLPASTGDGGDEELVA